MSENHVSLRRLLLQKLLVPIITTLIASSVMAYCGVMYFAHLEYNRTLYDMVQSLAHQVRKTASGPVLDLSGSAEKLFLWDDVDMTYFRVFGERAGQIGGNQDLQLPVIGEDFHGVNVSETTVRGETVRAATLLLDVREMGEKVYVQVAETQHKRRNLVRNITLAVLLPQLMLIALAMILLSRGIGWGLEPLAIIVRRLEGRDHLSHEAIPDEVAPSEVHALTRALNGLLARLDLVISARRKFVADAAHQLRTPLTAIQLNLDRALSEPKIEAVHMALEQARLSTDRAVRLSQQLLALARAESGNESVKLALLDLSALARECGAEWVPLALRRGAELSFESNPQSVQVRGDATLLYEAVSNLLDNALKYAGPHARIQISVSDKPLPQLCIRDDGPGIPVSQREAVLHRFSRGDTSREGTGLGLAIVAETAQRHHARLDLSDGLDGAGLTVTLEFPAPVP